MKNKKRLDGKKLCLALTSKLETDMRSFLRDKGIESESELVRQAISNYIYADYTEDSLKLQGMKKIQEQIVELRDMLDVVFKYLSRFHLSFLAYHPEIDPQLADAAFASATVRNDKFFDKFQDSLKNDPPFFERLLHKYYTEDSNGQN
ncbi:MAG: hypothetical protein LBV17_03985 [Treponema sp.]|jgi:hypothetical protein|nr:hypothetical protein [Treponema sp.]